MSADPLRVLANLEPRLTGAISSIESVFMSINWLSMLLDAWEDKAMRSHANYSIFRPCRLLIGMQETFQSVP